MNADTSTPPQGQASAGAPVLERVSVVSGDRPCASCGFNLTGQHIAREPHYGMLVVNCPECGTAAALQEYPLLGRWANRWGALLAALWVLAMLALLGGSVGALFGFSYGAAQAGGTTFATFVAERQLEWARTDEALRVPRVTPAFNGQYLATIIQQGAGPWSALDPNWWSAQDPGALLEAAGGWWRALDLRVVLVWTSGVLPMAALGVVWAVALSHVRRSRLWLVVPVVVALAWAISGVVWSTRSLNSPWPGAWILATEVARRMFFVPVMAASGVVLSVPLLAGLVAGRPLARLMVRAFLAPRLRAPLSFLWICDGKPLPRPQRR